MSAYRWNGEYWYQDERGLPRRALDWFAWFGGWSAFAPKKGETYSWTLRERLSRGLLTPVSFFGHRITVFDSFWQVRLRGGYLVFGEEGRTYFSPDGTPSSATIWFKGAPEHVRAAAAERTKVAA